MTAVKRAIRDVYGDTLAQLGSENKNIIALDADVGSSSKSIVFGKAFPERYFNVGIAEANGGSGGSLSDQAAVLRIAGRYAAPIPLAPPVTNTTRPARQPYRVRLMRSGAPFAGRTGRSCGHPPRTPPWPPR